MEAETVELEADTQPTDAGIAQTCGAPINFDFERDCPIGRGINDDRSFHGRWTSIWVISSDSVDGFVYAVGVFYLPWTVRSEQAGWNYSQCF